MVVVVALLPVRLRLLLPPRLLLLVLDDDDDKEAGNCDGRRFQFNRRAVQETPRVTPGVQLAVPTKTRSISELVVLVRADRLDVDDVVVVVDDDVVVVVDIGYNAANAT